MKRFFDLLFVIPALAVFAPVIFILTISVRLFLGPSVFFKQLRPGKNGVPFRMYKFRTMTNGTDLKGKLLPDAQRMTTFGNFLRKSSLDELPELFNILKGDMSIVGPRPLLMQYLDRYTPEQARRHEVKPGLTGWAQVNGRNTLSWEDKFKLDVWYVDNRSLWLDIKIILVTIRQVLKREGINHSGEATMPEFNPQVSQMDAD